MKGENNMDKTLSLQQSVMQDVVSLMGDNVAMRKLQAFLKTLKKERAEELDTISKEEVMDDLREAFKELKMVKEGKLKLKTWEEFKHELHC